MTTQQLLLATIATATIIAAAAGLKTARRLHRYRWRPISWTCLCCGHSETSRARTRGEAWSWIGARSRGHATEHLHAGDGYEIHMAHTVPHEFRRNK